MALSESLNNLTQRRFSSSICCFLGQLKVSLSLLIKTIKTTPTIKTINAIDAFKLTVLICLPSHYMGI
ncbi:hypothetical protein HMPREF0201_00348 [Cedecea davisae DSM 4568]|uniref:Uncharacterized protein n=1 Tax=Cedecea davisae DSM 4568 TaxID=566551 RepID=S3JKE8_9ENTR|nr:hypothetical protein HMPREF0201_00348 [Cedecea davisae DSM 4568]